MSEEDSINALVRALAEAQAAVDAAERDYERFRATVDSAGELALTERVNAEESRLNEIIARLVRATGEREATESPGNAPP